MALFHEVRLDENISYGSKGGPQFKTLIVVLGSGYEQRDVHWERTRRKYDVAYGVRSSTDLDALVTFFLARRGNAYGFRYKDWTDYRAIAQPTTELTTTTFQLLKRYTSGGESYDHPQKKIVSGTPHVFEDAVEVMAGWTANYNTGVVTFSVAPSGVITATFEFDVPVRFLNDEIETSMDHYMRDNVDGVDTYIGQASVPLIEIKV